MYTAERTGLDPLARQIYAVKRSGRMTIQTGIDGYRLIADRTNKLAGISDYMYDSESEKNPGKATVTVKKVVEGGILAEFTATARWGEYNAGGPMWGNMPFLMLGKCAEALALRKAFPADLSGVYTAEEMDQANNPERDAVFAEVERQKQASPTSDLMMKDSLLYEKTSDIPMPRPPINVIPPELDWSYNKSSGVLICRPANVKKAKNKKGTEFVVVTLNNYVEDKNEAFYFHKSHVDALLGAAGKVCKFMMLSSKGFVNIDEVLEINGVKMEAPKEDLETQARLLASVVGLEEEELRELYSTVCQGSWTITLDALKQRKSELDAGVEVGAR